MIEKLKPSNESDERGVSPVLGVALLIGITVTLVAVVGIVVLGVGPSATVPSADFTFDAASDDKSVTLTHNGGDSLNGDNIVVSVNGSSTVDVADGSTLTAGDSVTVSSGIDTGATVKVVWKSPDSDKSVVLSEYTV